MEYDPNTPMNFSKPTVMPQNPRVKMLNIYLAAFFAMIPHTLLIGAYIRHTNIKQSIEMEQRVIDIKSKIEIESGAMCYEPASTSRYTAPPTPPPPSGNLRCMNGTLLKRENNTWQNIGDC